VNAKVRSPVTINDRRQLSSEEGGQLRSQQRNLVDFELIPFEDGPEPEKEENTGAEAEEEDETTEEGQGEEPEALEGQATEEPDLPETVTPAPQMLAPTLTPTRLPTQSPTQPPQLPQFMVSRSPTAPPRPGDFAKFNEIFKNAVIAFPDLDIQENVIYQPLSISLTEFTCSKISFEDIKVDPRKESDQKLHIDLEVLDLAISCEFDFSWSYIFLGGSGHAVVSTGENSVLAGLDIFSEDYNRFPPDSAEVTLCQTDFNIQSLKFG
jgi:hypothetical protein